MKKSEAAKPVKGWALMDAEGRICTSRIYKQRRRIVAVTIVAGHVSLGHGK